MDAAGQGQYGAAAGAIDDCGSCNLKLRTGSWKLTSTLSFQFLVSSFRLYDRAVTAIEQLDVLLAEITDLRYAISLVGWDERVNLPPGGVATRGAMLATLRSIEHAKFTADRLGRLIEQATAEAATLDADDPARRKIAVVARDFGKATRVPGAFVAAHAEAVSAAHQAWREAREASDFSRFASHLERIVDLKREYAGFFKAGEHPYDALLDDFEPAATTADVQQMFDALRHRQVALLKNAAGRHHADDSFLRAPYAEQEMLGFAIEVITKLGFDWHRGRQDKSTHPFAVGISTGDVRITTRFVEHHPFELLFSMLHETGHALYEQGIDARWNRTPLAGGASLGVHESQSRLWENVIGRSRPFWVHFYPQLQRRFAAQLGHISLDQFYRAINKVEPSLIRVEADEVTYNLHVMLRVEMEIGMMNGAIAIAEVEACWNDRMRDYLGVMPSDAAHGVLQDMHWSVGLFGYFATYTIGNLLSVQLWRTFQAEHPSWERDLSAGEFAGLRDWLRERLHRHGKAYQPKELVARITGKGLDPEPYLTYLEQKYS